MIVQSIENAICIPCGSTPANCDCWRELNDASVALFWEGHISPPSAEVIETHDGRVFVKREESGWEMPPRYSYPTRP